MTPVAVERLRDEDLLDADVPLRPAPSPGLGRRRAAGGFALGAIGLPLLTLLLDRGGSAVSLETVVLLYLLAVVLVALVGGVVPALLSAVAAAMLINWYFVAPRHTLDVASGEQALALAVFVAVAAIVSGAVELAARRARAAEQAAADAETLSSLAGPDLDGHDALRAVLEQARRTFAMESVVLLARARDTDGWDDVERAGWGPPGHEAPLRFDVPTSGGMRLVGRGPALFAQDQRVLRGFAAAAQTAYDGRRLSAKAREAQTLAAVDRQRSALLAAVGHDLRTPLAGIKAAVSSLRQSDVEWSPSEVEDLLATVEDSADRLDAVVSNLLDASRLQAGAMTVHAVPVALDEAVAGALLTLPDGHGRVRVEVREDLPLVLADPGLLERVLANLIDNALRHGGGAAPVLVSATAGRESAKVAVVDHGPGVPAAEQEQLFEPFRRLDDRGAGVGLGLAVARGFADAMGGALVADESPGGGLTMRLRLPLAVAPA